MMPNTEQIGKPTTQTRNDKKREVLEYVEGKFKQQDILSLQREEIISELSDNRYSSELIDDIIDEVISEESVEKGSFTLELLYPEGKKETVTDVVSSGSKWSVFKLFSVGFYIFLGIILLSDSNSIFLEANNDQVVWISFFGITLSYIFGHMVGAVTSFVEAQVPLIQEYKCVIYPTIGILFAGSLILIAYSHVTGNAIPAVAIASFFPASIIAGVELGKYIESQNTGIANSED